MGKVGATAVGSIVIPERPLDESCKMRVGAKSSGKISSLLKRKDLAYDLIRNKVGEKDSVVPKKKETTVCQGASQPIIEIDSLYENKSVSMMTLSSRNEKGGGSSGPDKGEGTKNLNGLENVGNEMMGPSMCMEVDFEFRKNNKLGQCPDQLAGVMLGEIKDCKQYGPKAGTP
ncbi:hypothetical protein Q3G72_027060 [Acer saccharum]|nr:hypothetical protein Q3G72_027060 [Acer saccharum]